MVVFLLLVTTMVVMCGVMVMVMCSVMVVVMRSIMVVVMCSIMMVVLAVVVMAVILVLSAFPSYAGLIWRNGLLLRSQNSMLILMEHVASKPSAQ